MKNLNIIIGNRQPIDTLSKNVKNGEYQKENYQPISYFLIEFRIIAGTQIKKIMRLSKKENMIANFMRRQVKLGN